MIIPEPFMYREWKEWASALIRALQPQPERRDFTMLPIYTVETLPPPKAPGLLVLVSNESGGETLAFSDSAGKWRRATDLTEVS